MPFAVYSLLRLGLVVLAGGALWLAGARGWLLAVLAVVVAVPLSFLLLDRQRRAAATWLEERATRRRLRRTAPRADDVEEDASVERSAEPSRGDA